MNIITMASRKGGAGKSTITAHLAALCHQGGFRTLVIDAPGAVLVTSTRTDLHELTAALRTRRGPVYVFNAVGLGDLPSTITFNPLTGCTDMGGPEYGIPELGGALACALGS